MCGLFSVMQVKGFVTARETVLLPLLVAFFFKSISSNKQLVIVSLLLGLFFMQTALYFPIVVFFTSLFICMCIMTWKILLMLDSFIRSVFFNRKLAFP